MAKPRIALVGAEDEENLSLRYLAAAVAARGFDAELVPWRGDVEAIVRTVLGASPLLVGLSIPFQVSARETLGLAAALRAGGYLGHVVVGGHFATFEHERILRDFPAVDSVCRHEGEETLAELCVRLGRGEAPSGIAGLVVRRPQGSLRLHGASAVDLGPPRPLPPLDALPHPDRRGVPQDILGVPAAPIIGSRGCYADCSFCCIYAYAQNADGPRYRMRSVDDLVREMEAEYHRRGVRLFVFHDDNFFVPDARRNRERYARFAERLASAGLRDVGFVLKCRPNDVDRALFVELRALGLIRAYVGIETNSDEGVVSLNRRITAADNERALAVLDDLGVYHSFNLLLFDPEATLEGIAENVAFLERHAGSPSNFCRAEVYAGTPLLSMLRAQGRLRGDYFAWGYEMRDGPVELLFRLTSAAFAPRNFKPDGVHGLNMGIRFDAEVLRRFYPAEWDEDLGARLVALSRAIGGDTVAHLRAALDFVSAPARPRTAKDFGVEQARAIAAADLRFTREIRALRRELEARVAHAAGPIARRAYAATRAPWAAESLRLGASDGREISTERLPAPSFP